MPASFYRGRVDEAEQRIKREAPQMRTERLDYGFRLLVYPPDAAQQPEHGMRFWVIFQPQRDENGQRHIATSPQLLGEMIERWNRDYAGTAG